MAKETFSYTKAMEEIQSIVEKIEANEPDVDELGELVKRAASLIRQCKEKLRSTGEDLERVLGEFEED